MIRQLKVGRNTLLYGADKQVAEFVMSRIPGARGRGFGDFTAIGIAREGRPIGGVVFHNYVGHLIEMSAAFDDPRWCTRATLRTLFEYPFKQLNCVVMVTVTGRKNKKARRIDEGLGFRVVGPVPNGWDGREDAMVYAMKRNECRWIKGSS